MKFIAMNRFKIALNRESDFENIWAKRETHLSNVPGFGYSKIPWVLKRKMKVR